MKSCHEGAFTAGHLWMAALCGAIAVLVLVAVLRDLAASRDPPPEG
ncbi:hypothetical protein MKK68_24895 [Methylobacterium sp. E-016]|nr:hypothetical protein [Methylobacterium sp. E-016]MCJ2078837.1 hypothetical protein [Methylobacterium sp. E-016]